MPCGPRGPAGPTVPVPPPPVFGRTSRPNDGAGASCAKARMIARSAACFFMSPLPGSEGLSVGCTVDADGVAVRERGRGLVVRVRLDPEARWCVRGRPQLVDPEVARAHVENPEALALPVHRQELLRSAACGDASTAI